MSSLELMAEAHRRGILPPDKEALYQEAVSRGLIGGGSTSVSAPKVRAKNGSKTSTPMGLIEMAAQGLTFGHADELAGLLNKTLGRESYESTVNRARKGMERFREDHPYASLGAEIGGGLMTGGVGAVKAVGAKALSKIPRVGRSMMAASGQGALAGAGYSEEGDKLAGAATGATVGTALGGVIPGGSALVRGAGRLSKTGAQELGRAAFNSPRTKALRRFAGALERDELSPGSSVFAAKVARQGLEAPLVTAGGKNVLGLGEHMAQSPGKAQNQISRTLERAARKGRRNIKDSLTENLSNEKDFYGHLNQLNEQKRASANVLYDTAYARPINYNQTLRNITSNPYGKEAIKYAQKLAQGEDIGDAPTTKIGETRVWDYVKQGLDRVVEKHTNALGKVNKEGYVALKLKDRLLKELDRQNDDYRIARKTFAGDAANEKALEMGRKFFNQDAEVTTNILKRMSESERDNYRAGSMRAVMDRIAGRADGADMYTDVFKREKYQSRLKAVFPDNKSFLEFAKVAKRMSNINLARGRMQGNSATARRLAQAEDFDIEPALSAGRDFTYGGIPAVAAGGALSMLRKRLGMSEDVRNELGKMLVSDDPIENAQTLKLIEEMYKNPQTKRLLAARLGPRKARYMPAAAGVSGAQAGGLLSGERY